MVEFIVCLCDFGSRKSVGLEEIGTGFKVLLVDIQDTSGRVIDKMSLFPLRSHGLSLYRSPRKSS